MEKLTNAFDKFDIYTVGNITEKHQEDKRFLKVKDPIFINYCDKYRILYDEDKLDIEEYIKVLELAVQLEVHEKYKDILGNMKNEKQIAAKIEESKMNYSKGIELFNKSQYQNSISYLEKVIKDDYNYNDALEKIDLAKVKINEMEAIAKKEA